MVKNLTSCRVLITGGAGYLGGRIGEYLALKGYDVYLGSRKPFPHNVSPSCSNIITNWQDPNLTFCKDFDIVVHAAGMNAKSSLEYPEEALKINGKLSEKLIDKAVTYGCKSFFFLSSVHVYQSPLLGDFDESSQTLNTHPYATSQIYGEQALIKALKSKKIAGAVLRLSNCFGPPANNSSECWNLVLNEFIRSAYLDGKIIINGNCLSKRDFLAITELNQTLLQIFARQDLIPEVINISSGKSRTLLDVASKVCEIVFKHTGNSVQIVNDARSETESSLNIKNIALGKMNIFPNNDLEVEIKRMLNFLELG